MTEHKEVHSFVVVHCDGGVDLFLEAGVLIYLECVCHTICALVSNEALFEDEWRIPLHILNSSILLSLLIHYDVEFLHWLLVLPIQLNMHLNHFASLASNNIIQLPCEVFRREAEILRQDNMPENILSISPLNGILVLPGQVLVNSPRLENQHLVHVIVQLEQLPCHEINLHHNSIRNLVRLRQVILLRHLVLKRHQRCILIHNANPPQLTRSIWHLQVPWLERLLADDHLLFGACRELADTGLVDLALVLVGVCEAGLVIDNCGVEDLC